MLSEFVLITILFIGGNPIPSISIYPYETLEACYHHLDGVNKYRETKLPETTKLHAVCGKRYQND